MAKEKSKELIDKIVDKMQAHELPYLEGAWEKFVSNNNPLISKKSSNWKYWSSAAALLLVSSAAFLYLAPSGVQQETRIAAGGSKEKKVSDVRSGSEATTVDEVVAVGSQDNDVSEGPIEKKWANQSPLQIKLGGEIRDLLPKQVVYAHIDEVVPHMGVVDAQSVFIDIPLVAKDKFSDNRFVTNEGAQIERKVDLSVDSKEKLKDSRFVTNERVNNEKSADVSVGEKLERLGTLFPSNSQKHDFASALKKWEIGAFVSPTSTVDEISLGGGLSLAYQLTDKISVRSGVSMQSYGAGADRQRNPGAVMSASMAYNDALAQNMPIKGNNGSMLLTKQDVGADLSAVNNKLLTIDIPVDVRYHVSKSFYTSVGVSYVGVLDQTQDNYFVNGINENTAINNGKAVSSPENIKQTFKGNAVNTKEFNGFINLSIGKKMEVGSKLSIAVEPFVKLPVGGLKSTDLNYTNGGLKVVTSF